MIAAAGAAAMCRCVAAAVRAQTKERKPSKKSLKKARQRELSREAAASECVAVLSEHFERFEADVARASPHNRAATRRRPPHMLHRLL